MSRIIHPELFPVTAQRAAFGHLLIGGCDVVALAAAHGTPLYLYDQATLDGAVMEYRTALAAHWSGEAAIAYAAKAWLNTTLLRWAAAQGLGMDVVSEGELRHALHAGFPAERLHVHGNNKSDAFLHQCLRLKVGCIVLDHPREAERLAQIARPYCLAQSRKQAVWLRLNPATAARTHASIETGSATSKFGLSLSDGSAWEVARFVLASPWLEWRGVHFHIGSQFADPAPLVEATRRVFDWLTAVQRETGWAPAEFSPGGGWAVPYVPGDPRLAPADALPPLADAILEGCARLRIDPPQLVLEPGRELVARAGVALYTVGALKQAATVRYAFLDGGLADNARPALYGARYTALLANRDGEGEATYTLAGPYCESGDVLARDVSLPELREGDLLAVPVSGAYQLSMASNYNGAPRPAVLWLHEGRAQVAQRREAVEGLWGAESGGSGSRLARLHVEKELLESVRKRPRMYLHPFTFSAYQTLRSGMGFGLQLAGEESEQGDDLYKTIAQERGWDPFRSMSVAVSMMEADLDDETILNELIALDIEWLRRKIEALEEYD